MSRKAVLFLLFETLVLIPFAQSAIAQQVKGGVNRDSNQSLHSVSGQVVDADGEPVVGATIHLGNELTSTNVDGFFTIKVPSGEDTLKVTYIGMKPAEVKVSPGENITITLENDATVLSDVVVTGIVNKNKSSFTGSASTFTGKELLQVGVQNPLTSLAALDPSLNLMTNEVMGSNPNVLPDINIRGKSSIIGERDNAVNDPNQPLFIVDGFESSLEAVYNLDINRIESMTILKDAASTAIYGSKAANGVVVVETIKPQPGKLRFNYNGSLTVSTPDLSSYNLMNSKEKLEFEYLAGRYTPEWGTPDAMGGISNGILVENAYNQKLADIAAGVDTYWLSEPLRTGYNQRHNIYIDGGSGGFTFGLGINYNGITGIMKDSKRDIFTGTIDITYRHDKLRFTNKFNASKTSSKNPIVPFQDYALANPYYRKYDEDGNVTRWLENNDFAVASNPIYNASLNSRDASSQLYLTDYLMAEYIPIPQVRLSGKLGLSYSNNDNEYFISPKATQFEGLEATKKGSFKSSYQRSTRYDFELTAVYAEVFDKNRFNIAADFKMSEDRAFSQGYTVEGFPDGDYSYPSFSNGFPEGTTPVYYEDVIRSLNLLGTVNYAFDGRYLLDANFAVSGSSVFGSSKRFKETWSVGAGWNIMNEKFFREKFPNVLMFKLRGSIGNPGNQGFDSAMSLITYSFLYDSFNYFGNSTAIGNFGNPNLKWQNTLDCNVGVDFHTTRWNVEVDYFNKKTDPLLLGLAVPLSTGLNGLWYTNLGLQRSKGILATASYYIIYQTANRLMWNVRATLRHESIKLDNLNGALDDLNTAAKTTSVRRYYDGADPDDIWAVRSAGIDPANGKEIFIKKDGSRTYDYDPDDEVIVGNTRPKIEGTLGTTLNWKGFTISAIFNYRLGGKALNAALYNKVENITTHDLIYNQDKRALTDRWQNPGDIAQFKDIADSSSTPISSRFVQRNNSLTFQSLNLSYDFYEIAHKLKLESLRLSFYCNDLFYISTIKQERGTSYPFSRSYTFSLSFSI